jgi:hypothetical protein
MYLGYGTFLILSVDFKNYVKQKIDKSNCDYI